MRHALILALMTVMAPAALAQDATPPERSDDSFEDKAESVLQQPLKDLGIMREEAPAILLAARAAPYSLKGLGTCRQLAAAIEELEEILGADVDAVDANGDPLPGRLAEAGARSVVGALIPFRGLVREATGAAQSDRELRSVLVAGAARRSFLKGYAKGRGCKR